jgi:hypothetical protein
MGSGEKIEVLPNGTVLFEHGPMRLFIQALEHETPLIDLAREGARKAKTVLEQMALFLPVIKRKSRGLKLEEDYPDVIRRMIDATQKMGEPDLTPMAAVAGAASDEVADFMVLRGGTKIIVDNGGDIAIRLREGEVARVGIKTEVDAKEPSYIISIRQTMGIGGIATSGLGGRSFTKGIASAATVLSESASCSDAAATVIGNATKIDDPLIRRSLAESIYPETDIAGEWVTVEVGKLSSRKIDAALRQGLEKANAIRQKGLIKGALIAVKGRVGWTPSMEPWLTKL